MKPIAITSDVDDIYPIIDLPLCTAVIRFHSEFYSEFHSESLVQMNKNCSLLLNFSGSYQLYPVLTSYGSQIAVSKQKVPSRTEMRLFPSLTKKVIMGYFSAYK